MMWVAIAMIFNFSLAAFSFCSLFRSTHMIDGFAANRQVMDSTWETIYPFNCSEAHWILLARNSLAWFPFQELATISLGVCWGVLGRASVQVAWHRCMEVVDAHYVIHLFTAIAITSSSTMLAVAPEVCLKWYRWGVETLIDVYFEGIGGIGGPYNCRISDCSYLHANSCYEHSLIYTCCCNNPYH